MDLSILIPSYNGGKILFDLVARINENLLGKYSFEIIFVFDDGNIDTWQNIKELKKEFPETIKVYRLAKNYGQHKAIQFGLGKAKGNLIITIDEDLQHDPGDIFKLIEKQQEGNYDVVYGRFPILKHKGIRNKISAFLRKILKHFIPYLYYNYSSYRLIKKDVAYTVSTLVSPYVFIDDLLCRITQNIAFVNITHQSRTEGKSSYTIGLLLWHGVLIILNYSRIIKWFLVAGTVLIFSGLILIIFQDFPFADLLINGSKYLLFIFAGSFFLIAGFLGFGIKLLSRIKNSRPVFNL